MFRLGVYIQELMNKDEILKKYNLDNEYNRNMDDSKRNLRHLRDIFTDLIIHKRRRNDNNIAVIECKTYWNNDIGKDSKKLKI